MDSTLGRRGRTQSPGATCTSARRISAPVDDEFTVLVATRLRSPSSPRAASSADSAASSSESGVSPLRGKIPMPKLRVRPCSAPPESRPSSRIRSTIAEAAPAVRAVRYALDEPLLLHTQGTEEEPREPHRREEDARVHDHAAGGAPREHGERRAIRGEDERRLHRRLDPVEEEEGARNHA